MSEPRNINNLAEYIEWVSDNPKTPTFDGLGHSVFFRGHSSQRYKLEPSVYRNANYRQYEQLIYWEMLKIAPDEFKDVSARFENLVKMQHHGVPTRLLDVTPNSLVALFFACSTGVDGDTNGKVFRFNVPAKLCNFQAEIPEASLLFLPPSFSWVNTVLEVKSTIIKELSNISPNTDSSKFRSYEMHPKLDRLAEDIKEFENLFSAGPEVVFGDKTIFSNAKNKLSEMLGIQFKKEMQLSNCILQLGLPAFAYAPMNNERIRRQQGAFVIFPPAPFEVNPLDVHSSEVIVSDVIIPFGSKAAILNQLESAGINRHFLFPEMAEYANFVREKYGKKIDENLKIQPHGVNFTSA